MANLKPQVPMMSGGDYIYPVTTIDQVLMEDGERASEAVATKQYVDNRSGIELLWTNPNPLSSFAAQTITVDLSDYSFVHILLKLDNSGGASALSQISPKGLRIIASWAGNSNRYRVYTATDNGVNFEAAYIVTAFGSQTQDNGYVVPYQIYGIK